MEGLADTRGFSVETPSGRIGRVAAVLPPGGSAMTIDESARVIAVDMPNENGIKGIYWQRFRVPVREIEQKTGYNFFSDVPQELQDKLEGHADNY